MGERQILFNNKKKVLLCPELQSTAFGDTEGLITKRTHGGAGNAPSGMMRMKAFFGTGVLITCQVLITCLSIS